MRAEGERVGWTSGGQSVQIDVEDRFFRALVQIRNVLGPDNFGCSQEMCEGCQVEGAEALRIANEALGFIAPQPPLARDPEWPAQEC